MLDPVLDMALRGAVAFLFIFAAWHKMRDPIAFWQVLDAYQLLPEKLVRPASRLVPLAELGTGFTLLALPSSVMPLVMAIGLWTLYGAAISINLLRGRTQLECGCGGVAADQTIRWALVVRNIVLVGCTALLFLPAAVRELLWLDFGTILFGGLMLVLLYAATDHLLRNAALLSNEGAHP